MDASLELGKQLAILGTRRRAVLILVCKGLTNREIAHQVGLSERSVKAYMSQLFLIFDVSNRTELAGLGSDFASQLEDSLTGEAVDCARGERIVSGSKFNGRRVLRGLRARSAMASSPICVD